MYRDAVYRGPCEIAMDNVTLFDSFFPDDDMEHIITVTAVGY